jgi:citrate lyase beta subunit
MCLVCRPYRAESRKLLTMTTILPPWLAAANHAFAQKFPGEAGERQPVHAVYGGAHLFKFDTCQKFGTLAERAVNEYAPEGQTFAEMFDVAPELAETVRTRVMEKLRREPVEDYRVDFEDGYGTRPDAEEDAAAVSSAAEVAKGMSERTLPPFLGIRVKALGEETKGRAARTLDLFLNALLDQTGGKLPPKFVVTLPKITAPEQVHAMAEALKGLPGVGLEVMIETPQILFHIDQIIEAGQGKIVAASLGPYDYTSSLGISSTQQNLLHPACEFARSIMQVSFAGTGVRLGNGPTTILPIPKYRGADITDDQKSANRDTMRKAWTLHYRHVRHELHNGFFLGWDLHPAQLPSRYTALYSFFLEGLHTASERLKNFIASAAQATRIGDVFDDAATGQGLLSYFLRAMSCGAIPESEIPALTGLSNEQLRTASFAQILKTL